MKLAHASGELDPRGRKVSIAIGVFDGVHLGHQQVIRQTINDAQQHEGMALVVTFDRHPNAVVAPDRTPLLIYPLEQKLRLIDALGADAALIIRFDEEFSRTPAEKFIRSLVQSLGNVFSICVGSTFTFGFKRQGNVELLRRLGTELGFIVHGLAAVSLDGERVSSTRIREAIQSGDLDAASQMLGRAYSLTGTVVRGDELGRQLGFPTANLDACGLALPPAGVYAVHAEVDGVARRGVLNIGVRPTVRPGGAELRVEVHLLDFSGDLYGKALELTFVGRIREERRFPSIAALQEQIGADIRAARALF